MIAHEILRPISIFVNVWPPVTNTGLAWSVATPPSPSLLSRHDGDMLDPVNDVVQVTAQEAQAQLDAGEVTLLDVREHYEWAAGHASGAIHIPLGELRAEAVQGEKPVVVMCHMGGRSQAAAEALKGAGFDARNLAGGILAWEAAGLEVVRP